MIFDTDGNALDERPDYSAGRLLDIQGRVTYVTYEEIPQGTGIAAEQGETPPDDDEDAVDIEAVAAQVDYTAVMTDTVLP